MVCTSCQCERLLTAASMEIRTVPSGLSQSVNNNIIQMGLPPSNCKVPLKKKGKPKRFFCWAAFLLHSLFTVRVEEPASGREGKPERIRLRLVCAANVFLPALRQRNVCVLTSGCKCCNIVDIELYIIARHASPRISNIFFFPRIVESDVLEYVFRCILSLCLF